MRLGERSTRIRTGGGVQLIGRFLALGLTFAALAQVAPASAQGTATAGPGRIVCNAAFCEMGSSARPKERVRIIVSNLPPEEVRRLRKCTGVAKPCIVSIEGTSQADPKQIMASAIQWQD